MTPLERIDKQIELLEDAVVIYRSYPGGTEIIGQNQILSDLFYLRQKREMIIKKEMFKYIRKFKFLK